MGLRWHSQFAVTIISTWRIFNLNIIYNVNSQFQRKVSYMTNWKGGERRLGVIGRIIMSHAIIIYEGFVLSSTENIMCYIFLS